MTGRHALHSFLHACPADETVHDAVLLLDRAMSVPLEAASDQLLPSAMAACLLLVAARPEHLPPDPLPAPVRGVC